MARVAGAPSLPASAARPNRTAFFAIVVLALLTLLCAPFFVDHIDHDAPQARQGVIDYSQFGPLSAPVELKGEWRFVWHTAPAPEASLFMAVPGEWDGKRVGDVVLPEAGSASYHLTLRGLQPGRYTIYVPRITAASRVLVNGRLMSDRGRVRW
jgi:adenylate cyclase